MVIISLKGFKSIIILKLKKKFLFINKNHEKNDSLGDFEEYILVIWMAKSERKSKRKAKINK